MGRLYTVAFTNDPNSGATPHDFFEIVPADEKLLAVHAVFIGNESELGESEEEQIAYRIYRGWGTGGTGGTATTPRPVNPNDPAAGFTATVMNSSQAGGAGGVQLWGDTFNVRTGLQLIFPPEMRLMVAQAQTRLNIGMFTDSADVITFSGTLVVEEF